VDEQVGRQSCKMVSFLGINMSVTVAKKTLAVSMSLSILFFLAGFLTASQMFDTEFKNMRSTNLATKEATDIINASIHDHILADKNVTSALQARLDDLHESDFVTIQELRNHLRDLNESHVELLKILDYHFTNKLKKELKVKKP
jgi:hypothetical protein